MRDDDPPKFGALPRKKIRNLSRRSREARRRIRDSPPLRLRVSVRDSFRKSQRKVGEHTAHWIRDLKGLFPRVRFLPGEFVDWHH
jgi:hypothetical protein